MSNGTSVGTSTTETVTAGGCCGGPAPEGTGACCARDAEVKAGGGSGCGCGSAPATTPKPAPGRSGCCG
jgi:hypothetical protein